MTDPQLETFYARDAADRDHATAVRSATRAALFAALSAAGISRLQVDFDGAGDSGQIEAIKAFAGDAAAALWEGHIAVPQLDHDGAAPVTETLPIVEAIETLAYGCLDVWSHGVL